eukprot:UN28451
MENNKSPIMVFIILILDSVDIKSNLLHIVVLLFFLQKDAFCFLCFSDNIDTSLLVISISLNGLSQNVSFK